MCSLLLDLLADYQALLQNQNFFQTIANDYYRRSSQQLGILELVNSELEYILYSVSIISALRLRKSALRPLYLA